MSVEPAASGSVEITEPGASTDGTPMASVDAGAAAWEVLEPAPLERIEMAAAAHDGEIWLAGGLNANGSATDEVWRFDPTLGQWREGPALDRPLHHAAMVSTGDGLFVIGGYVGASFDQPRPTVLLLAEDGGSWTEGPALPEARAAGGAAWDGSRIVYGGGVGAAVQTEVYALEGNTWSLLGEMRDPREHVSATSDGAGRVWLLGGRTITLDTNTSAVDLVEGDAVTRIGGLPTPRGGAAAFYLPDLGACLAGGERPDRALGEVECVSGDGQMATLPPLPRPVHGHGGAVLEGAAYIMLGGPEPLLTVSDTIQRLAPGG